MKVFTLLVPLPLLQVLSLCKIGFKYVCRFSSCQMWSICIEYLCFLSVKKTLRSNTLICFFIADLILFGALRRATTHTDLVVRAKKMGIDVKIVHNASVMNAIGICGLQLYRYGETVSIPFFTETWRPDSFYEKIQRNQMMGLHTLCLLGQCMIFMG